MDIGKAIVALRKSKGFQQKELAYKSGITPSALCLIEKGKTWPSNWTIAQIARTLDIPQSYILLFGIEAEEIPSCKRDNVMSYIEAAKSLLMEDDINEY